MVAEMTCVWFSLSLYTWKKKKWDIHQNVNPYGLSDHDFFTLYLLFLAFLE